MFFRAVGIQLKRAISLRLLFLAVLTAVFQVICAYPWLVQRSDIYSLFMLSTTSYLSVYVIPPLVYAYSFTVEWKNRSCGQWIIRSGVNTYTASKICASAISGFLCVFLGEGLSVLIMMLYTKPYARDFYYDSYSMLMCQGHVFEGYLFYITDYAFSGAIAAAFGMVASAVVVTPYTAAMAPIIFFMLFSRIAEGLKLPAQLNPVMWMASTRYYPEAWMNLLYKGILTITVIIVMTLISVWTVRRRMEDDRA